MKETSIILVVCVVIIALIVGYHVSPSIRAQINENAYAVQKADDATRYETRKQVEDTARAMIASYVSDRLAWEQYKDSDNAEKRDWAETYKTRANNTAATYNAYILKNSFVWANNVPEDIDKTLAIITE